MPFFPLPRTYAVAQIDLPASLRGLGQLDREFLASLKSLRCPKAIIMLHTICELPLPRKSDFEYYVYVVGKGLRPDDPELCLTSDMCIPIFPNTSHPTGRAPVRTAPDFPFSNCYHWFGPDISLTLRIKNGNYASHDDLHDIKLPTGNYVDMEIIHQQDMSRVFEMRAEREQSEAHHDENLHDHEDVTDQSLAISHDAEVVIDGEDSSVLSDEDSSDSRFAFPLDECETNSLASGGYDLETGSPYDAPSSFPLEMSTGPGASTKSLTESDIFRMDWTEERSRIPVVTLSFDLEAEFKEEDVPSPHTFLEECKTFSRLVREFQEREATRPVKDAPPRRMLTTFSEMTERVGEIFKKLFSVA